MSTAFSGGFGTSTYGLRPGPATGSELLSGLEEEDFIDPVDEYFACITTCSLEDGECITRCVEELREHH